MNTKAAPTSRGENVEASRGSVVVGVDGSAHAERALWWAAAQAELESRVLTVVHVIKPLTTYELGLADSAGTGASEALDAVHAAGRELLREAVGGVRERHPELNVRTVLGIGDPREVLLNQSESAALLVLGSRGRGRIRTLLLGSVSVAVARHATCPVVVVRPHHPGAVRQGVLVGTDCGEATRSTVEFAYRQASLRKLPLTVLSCLWEPDSDGLPHGILEDDLPGLELYRARLSESVAGLAEKFPDVPTRLRLAHGLADDCLSAASTDMDLVVVGRHGTSPMDSAGLGSFAPSVVERADSPVAVVSSTPVRSAVG